jgi:hypothetical protein
MYDETPLVLPTQWLDSLLANFCSDIPSSEILTGTAGDDKTYHCRETWLALGGSEAIICTVAGKAVSAL